MRLELSSHAQVRPAQVVIACTMAAIIWIGLPLAGPGSDGVRAALSSDPEVLIEARLVCEKGRLRFADGFCTSVEAAVSRSADATIP